MKRALVAILRLALRAFYRRIEIDGITNVTAEGGTIFAVNHPNGLVDPLFLLSFVPRDEFLTILSRFPQATISVSEALSSEVELAYRRLVALRS